MACPIPSKKGDIGLIGLAVMGQNLILNMADNGFTVVAFNRTVEKMRNFLANEAKGKSILGAESIPELVSKLKSPRRIMLLVKAGTAVDNFIIQLVPHLDNGDIIIDGGNSEYQDTQRRTKSLQEKGIRFVGAGVSGGEEGARYGPSLMPGGNKEAWGKNIYDLWDDASGDLDNKKLAKKRTKYIPSIRQAVEIPPEGTSYNPSVDSYVKYANTVAEQEIRYVRQEKQELELMEACRCVKRKAAKFSEQTKVFDEILRPKNEVIVETEVVEKDIEQEDNVTDEKTEEDPKGPKARTIKQKRDAKLRRVSERQKQAEKLKMNLNQQLLLTKSIKKSVNKEISEHEKRVAARRQKRALDRLMEKKRLGRGKYEEFVEPVLLVNEITGNLRSAKQQSDILQERLNSLQKRNLIPIGGDSKTCPLKARLRHKFVEKRTTKEITKDSRVK